MGCVSNSLTAHPNKIKAAPGCANGSVCGTGGCNKMNSYDWLSYLDLPKESQFDAVEIRFKGGRKDYFRNAERIEVNAGDYVVCDMKNGFHIGEVALKGELVRLQMKKKNISGQEELKPILRLAEEKDLEKWTQTRARELPTMYRSREILRDMKLNMKLSDVEFQSDNTKATFYYSSEERVDFRELIKVMAAEFKVRIEMRQISLRQEAGRVGGIGSCGRELCCSSWLTDFKNISTSAARYQNLSLNPAKLSGQCGRLKCCLNYELDTYMDALKDIPSVEAPLKTQKGEAVLQKTDIFRKIMWFGINHSAVWFPVSIETVIEIIELNKKGIIPESLEVLTPRGDRELDEKGVINSDLIRLDRKYSQGNKKMKPKFRRNNKREGS